MADDLLPLGTFAVGGDNDPRAGAGLRGAITEMHAGDEPDLVGPTAWCQPCAGCLSLQVDLVHGAFPLVSSRCPVLLWLALAPSYSIPLQNTRKAPICKPSLN